MNKNRSKLLLTFETNNKISMSKMPLLTASFIFSIHVLRSTVACIVSLPNLERLMRPTPRRKKNAIPKNMQ